MTLFVQESGFALCFWILGSIALAIALLLLSVFDGKREELRENVIFPEGSFTAAVADAFIAPQEKLKNLESKISTKSAKLEISQEKIDETKKSISELEVTSGEVQVKYQELLRQLKSDLMKTETECQHLHDQIEKITTKRDKLKQELDEASRYNSSTAFENEIMLFEAPLNKPFNYNAPEMKLDSARRMTGWSSMRNSR